MGRSRWEYIVITNPGEDLGVLLSRLGEFGWRFTGTTLPETEGRNESYLMEREIDDELAVLNKQALWAMDDHEKGNNGETSN